MRHIFRLATSIVGVAAGFAAYYSGAGLLGAIVVGPIVGGIMRGVGQTAIETSRSRRICVAIALL
jgi:hypothetical protein